MLMCQLNDLIILLAILFQVSKRSLLFKQFLLQLSLMEGIS